MPSRGIFPLLLYLSLSNGLSYPWEIGKPVLPPYMGACGGVGRRSVNPIVRAMLISPGVCETVDFDLIKISQFFSLFINIYLPMLTH